MKLENTKTKTAETLQNKANDYNKNVNYLTIDTASVVTKLCRDH